MSHFFFEEALRLGQAAFPAVEVLPDPLRARLARCDDQVKPSAEVYLAMACACGGRGALEALEAHCAAELNAVLSRHAPASDRDDVLQHIRLRLLSALETYAGKGSLRGWVRIVATRAAIDLSRERASPEVADGGSLELPSGGDVELQLLKSRYRGVFEQALRAAAQALTPRERTLLRQHYLDDLSIDALGRLYAVHRSSAARWVVAARQRLVELTRAGIAQHGAVSAPEVDSLVRLMQSELHLSLGLLRGD